MNKVFILLLASIVLKMPKFKDKVDQAEGKSEANLKSNAFSEAPQTQGKSKRIPMNLNEYRHLINSGYITENDVSWVLTLRGAREKASQPK